KALCFLPAEIHLARFDDVSEWKREQARVHDLDVIRIGINMLARQTVDRPHQFAICARSVRRPAPALRGKKVSAPELRTTIRSGFRHGEGAKVSMGDQVLSIDQKSEIEFRRA